MSFTFFSDERFQQITFKVAKTQAEVDGDTGAFCGFFEGPITDPDTENPVKIYCPIPKVGRFVRVSASVDTLEICELEVYTKRNAT